MKQEVHHGAKAVYTGEFKLEAVRLIKQRGVSYAQASKDLGVHPKQLRYASFADQATLGLGNAAHDRQHQPTKSDVVSHQPGGRRLA